MSILDKFTSNDLNSLCEMNSFLYDMHSGDWFANRNIEQRINEAIYVVKRKIKYIHPDLCANTIIEQVISEGLDLDQMVIDKMEFRDIGSTIISVRTIIFYKCLIKLNYITNKIKNLFYNYTNNGVFIECVLRYYPNEILKEIENGYREFDIDLYNGKYQMPNLNKFGISDKRLHEYLMRGRSTVCEYKHLKNIFEKIDYDFSQYPMVQYSYNPFDFRIWVVMHDHELERFIEREYNGKSYRVHIHTVLEKIMEDSNYEDHFLPDIIKSYKDLKRFKFEDLIKVDSLKDKYEEIVHKNILLQAQYEIGFPEDDSFIDTDSIKVIRNSQELINEGDVMNHCVGGKNYIDRCTKGEIKIVHFDTHMDGGVTAEFVKREDGTFYSFQIKGIRNRSATKEETSMVVDYINKVNLKRL